MSEMYENLPVLAADYSGETIDVSMQGWKQIGRARNQRRLQRADSTYLTITRNSAYSIYMVECAWLYLLGVDKDIVTDIFHDPVKANKTARSIQLKSPVDDYVYVAHFYEQELPETTFVEHDRIALGPVKFLVKGYIEP